MRVCAIIVSYKSGIDLIRCIQSVLSQSYKPEQVVIVENGSMNINGTVLDRISNQSRTIKIIRNAQNLGFAKAVRQAFSTFEADWYLVLNPDCYIDTNYAKSLVNAIRGLGSRECCAITGTIVSGDGSVIFSRGALWDPITGYDWSIDWKTKNMASTGLQSLIKVDYIPFVAAFINGKIIRTIDDNLFLYNEDLDLCLSARRLGYVTYVCPNLTVRHKIELRKRPMSRLRFYHHVKGRLYLLVKHQPLPFLFTSFFFWTILLPFSLLLLNRSLANVCMRAVADFIRGVLRAKYKITRSPSCIIRPKPLGAMRALVRHLALGGHTW